MKRLLERVRSVRHVREVAGLLLLAAALVTLLALASYSASDPSWFTHRPDGLPVQNRLGRVGSALAEALLQLLGTAALLVAPALGLAGLRWLGLGGPAASRLRRAGHVVLVLALCALLDLIYGEIAYGGDRFAAGGYVGRRTAGLLRALLNPTGALLVSGTALVVTTLLLTRVSLVETLRRAGGPARAAGAALRGTVARWLASRRAVPVAEPTAVAPGSTQPIPAERAPRQPAVDVPAADAPPPEPALGPPAPAPRRRTLEPPRQPALPLEGGSPGYALPPVELLQEPEVQSIEGEQELLDRARLISDKLKEFAVLGTVVAVHPGPVVTTFEFKPEAGIKYSRITAMTDDLSLALRAESVRIDRMSGRATVGIEVPNRRQETIYPRELLASERFRSARSKLTLALGKDISGEVFVADLERMPHLLIAGATGSGKSVGLNGMIASILYKATPADVRFIMIDTKMIELGLYAEIPHLLVPVVTDPKQASTALQWACREMERRYRSLASVGVRNIAQFNEFLAKNPGRTMDDPRGGDPIPLHALPLIVIVIDELADLMLVSAADVEESILRLAQMARAVGIHLIIATQRPSVDVITGTIKANFPSRIAFRVAQRVDSRTIIDQQGAEHLLGRGDMLLLSSGSSRLRRVHGGLISEAELTRITSFVKKHARPEYDESVLRETEAEGEEALDDEAPDEMYLKAVRTVIQDGKCSITLIQRRLQLGYARAARIVDRMERAGVVGPGEGSKPREILVGPEFLDGLAAQPERGARP